ncbi:MAG: hypothetical protein K8J31_05910 [Anaerolineae bacterium]|nr:hypothetical protein [Anaerolineae bacterium]
MDIYTNQTIARAEHEHMVRSLPAIPEYGAPDEVKGWWSRLTTAMQSLKARSKSAPRTRPVLTVSSPSQFLRERIQEDSNYEMEWMWAAGHVTAPEEIRYCLERVLYINPLNADAQRALSGLTMRRVIANIPVEVNKRSFAPASDK